MAFCAKCGTQLVDGAGFCPNCGTPMQPQYPQAPEQPYAQVPEQQPYAPAPEQPYVQAPEQQYAQAPNPPYGQPYQPYQQAPYPPYAQAPVQPRPANNIFNTPDHTADMDANDIVQNKFMAVLAYAWLFVLIPLFGASKSKFARFHCSQGLLPSLAGTILTILTINTFAYSTAVGVILLVLDLCVLAFQILGVSNAASGKAKELPLFNKLTLPKE